MRIDATSQGAPASALPFAVGGTSPDGDAVGANSRNLTWNGRAWFPVMGEFHYARTPRAEWEAELLKMKSGGVTIVSTYVFWIHHEERKGRFDWSGCRDLREFAQLCNRRGLLLWVRLGPWAHGEARNGGFPDWLVKSDRLRTDDPAYLEQVRRFFGEIAGQLKGLYWKDGGPIVGIQVENEYHPASGGIEHMRTLLDIARQAGIDAPYVSATGWDRATVPEKGFLPVFGGYTEQFWSRSRGELPPNLNFFFTPIRAEDNVMGDLQPKNPGLQKRFDSFPFLTAEMGAGMAIAYHRRTIMDPGDSAAAALVKLGSGVSLMGYYMYHGGTNPDGSGPMQETQSAWHGYNDMEAKSYDFQAPIGENNRVTATARELKLLNTFLADFGESLAPMSAHFPDRLPAGRDDDATPRVAARALGRGAFVFFNNHQRGRELPGHPDFQVELDLPGEKVLLPDHPCLLPSGAFGFWPVHLGLYGVEIESATAQPLCRLAGERMAVFFAQPGVDPQFRIRLAEGQTLETRAGRVAYSGSVAIVSAIQAGPGALIRIRAAGRERLKILVLTREQALDCWKGQVSGRERLLITRASAYFDSDSAVIEASEAEQARALVYPELGAPSGSFALEAPEGIFQGLRPLGEVEPETVLEARQIRPAQPPPPVVMGPAKVAQEPSDADFSRAAVWSISLPAGGVGAGDILRIEYEGDVARAYAGGRLLDDSFYRGVPFDLALWRLSDAQRRAGIELKILPLRQDAPLYLPPRAKPAYSEGTALALRSVRIIHQRAWQLR